MLTLEIILSKTQKKISGKIISENNQKPLESATVYLERARDSTLITYTITDENGKWPHRTEQAKLIATLLF